MVIDDAGWLREQVDELTETQEMRRAHPWAVDDAPADYVDSQLRAFSGSKFRSLVSRASGRSARTALKPIGTASPMGSARRASPIWRVLWQSAAASRPQLIVNLRPSRSTLSAVSRMVFFAVM